MTEKLGAVYLATSTAVCGATGEISFSNVGIGYCDCTHKGFDGSGLQRVVAVNEHYVSALDILQCRVSGTGRSLVALVYDFCPVVIYCSCQRGMVAVQQGGAVVGTAVVDNGNEEGKVCLLLIYGVQTFPDVLSRIVYWHDDV